MAMVKLLDLKTGDVNTIKVKVIRNVEFLKVTNISSEQFIFNKNELLDALDLRSIGYYKVNQSNFQYHLEPYYELRPLQLLCGEFHKLTFILRREEQKSTDPHPWLAEDDERRNMSDRKILGKCVDVETSCLNQKEIDKLMEMLYK